MLKRVLVWLSILLVAIAAIIMILPLFSSREQRDQRIGQSDDQDSSNLEQPISSPLSMPLSAAFAPSPNDVIDVTTLDLEHKEVVFPFIRNGALYLYADGAESLIAATGRRSSQTECHDLENPFISPDKQFVSYIEQTEMEEYWGCFTGQVRILDLRSGKTQSPGFETYYASWANPNRLQFSWYKYVTAEDDNSIDPDSSSHTYTVYDPASKTIVVSEGMSITDAQRISGFPIYSDTMSIRSKNNKFFLHDFQTDTDTFLSDIATYPSSIGWSNFSGWSPDGQYAIFGYGSEDGAALALNIKHLDAPPVDFEVDAGSGGGMYHTGLKWYFSRGFASYCSQSLAFVDGSDPEQLTSFKGGGCGNAEGFVATAPNGKYSFVRIQDAFEIHTLDGQRTPVNEVDTVQKSRGMINQFYWLDDEHLILYSTRIESDGINRTPVVYLYTHSTNSIHEVVENGTLYSDLLQ